MKFTLLRLLLLSLLLHLTLVVAFADTAGNVNLLFLEEQGNKPVNGVKVEIIPDAASPSPKIPDLISSADGTLDATLLPGVYRYKASKEGFANYEGAFRAGNNEPLKVYLNRQEIIFGRLVDEQGKPLAGLTLKVSGSRTSTCISDGEGRFRVQDYFIYNNEPRTNVYLHLADPVYVLEKPVHFELQSKERRDLGDIGVRRGGKLKLTVVSIEQGRRQTLDKLEISLAGVQPGGTYVSGKATDQDGILIIGAIPPGRYRINSYDQRITSLAPQQVEIKSGEQTELTVEAALRPPEITFDDFGEVLLPEKAVKVRLNGFRINKAKVSIFRINPDLLLKTDFEQNAAATASPPGSKLIKSFIVALKGNKGNPNTRKTFKLPTLPPGAYQLDVRDAAQAAEQRNDNKSLSRHRKATTATFLVTRLALVTKNSPNGTIIYAADLANGKPLKAVTVSAYPLGNKGDGKPLFRVTTDIDGLAAAVAPSGGLRLVGQWQGNYARLALTPEQTPIAGGLKGYIYTERPAYRPGQTVYFKGVVRQRQGEDYQPPKAGTVRVSIVDSSEQSVMEREFPLSPAGSFHGEFTLAAKPALGGYTIQANSGSDQWQAGFKVLEYRKPDFEVTATQPHKFVLAGDKEEVNVLARYYFGAPVSSATVKYRLYSRQVYGFGGEEEGEYDDGDEGYYGGYADFIGEGEVKTDADGRALIPVETGPGNAPLSYTLELEVTDASSRQVAAATSFTVVPALINVSLRAQSYLAKPEQPVELTLKAATWEGAAVKAGFRVKVEEQLYDKKKRVTSFRLIDTVEAVTDATGQASFRYAFPRPGNWRLTAVTSDSRGRDAVGQEWVWVWQQGYEWNSSWRELGLTFDKKSYRPGETARLLVKNPVKKGHLLLTVEGRDVYSRRVVPLNDAVEVIELPVPVEYAPYVFISASMISNGRFYSRTRMLKVDHKPDLLTVAVTPEKPLYAPGERVRLAVNTNGSDGGKRAAELSVGVVDEAIYAIARERGDDLYTVFRGSRDHLVTTIHSFPRVYLGGAAKEGETAATEKQEPNRVRRVFKDTAFWLPILETGADGLAFADFDLPDNLTTWRATAIGHTAASEFGSGTAKFIARLDVMARLLPPRFLVQGDEVRIPAMINNVTAGALPVKGLFTAKGLTIVGDPAFSGTVPANGSLRHDLEVRAATAGEAIVRLDASAVDKGDAMELAIPVLPNGIRRQALGNILQREGGSGETVIDFPAAAFSDAAALTVSFAPSLAASLNQGIRELVEFPYGCVEQTMSRFLPAVYVRKLAQGGSWPIDGELDAKLPQVLDAGLTRLYDFQHEDGGWGWWKEDATDATMTAYVVYGLALAQKAGVEMKEEVLERGKKALAAIITNETGSRLPYAYRAFTMDGAIDLKAEERIEKQWQQLRLSEQLLYVEALLNRNETKRADQLLAGIRERVQRDGTSAWLKDGDVDSWWYADRWGGSAVETTAMLLESVLLIDANDPLAPQLAEFLLRKRTGRGWQTTRVSAMVIKALADYAGETGNYRARLLLNGKELERLTVQQGKVVTGRSQVSIPATALQRGGNLVRLEKTGAGGAAHLTAVLDYIVPPEMALQSSDIGIERQLFRITTRRDAAGVQLERSPLQPEEKLAPGDEVEVRLVINSRKEQEYIIIEDPLPAGFEVKETLGESRFADYGGYGDWYTHRERHDERMAFFVNRLAPGRHEFRYVVSPQIEGRMQALPASIWAMYQPVIRAESRPWQVTVEK